MYTESCCTNSSGQPEFIVYESDDRDDKLVLNQEDVRQVQLAKGSISGGILTLIDFAEIEAESVEKVFLAGAFGSYADPACVKNIKLIPDLSGAELISLGNAAGAGAILTLFDEAQRKKASTLTKATNIFDLASHPDFQDTFIEMLSFPT